VPIRCVIFIYNYFLCKDNLFSNTIYFGLLRLRHGGSAQVVSFWRSNVFPSPHTH
jgi:hypothetical protein